MNNTANFATEQTAEMITRIEAGTTTSVLGIPGAGITLFLKQLSSQPLGKVIYTDVFSLPNLTTKAFYDDLLGKLGGNQRIKDEVEIVTACQKRLKEMVTQGERVVIFIAGFDQLQPHYSTNFFHYLRSLRALDPTKIVFIFGICRRLETLLPADLVNTDLSLFSSVYYLQPYSIEDLHYLLTMYGPSTDLGSKELDRLIALSGGHFQFLQLLLGSERRHDPIQDPFIQLAFKNIFTHLSTSQKAIVRKLATDGTYLKADDYLTKIGIIEKTGDRYELFSELFADCVRAFSAPKLPVKERRLLSILKSKEGRIVPKRDIYDAVWRGEEIGTEWALNALIYRLRKHPAFTVQNFAIENHKKLGYSLVRNV